MKSSKTREFQSPSALQLPTSLPDLSGDGLALSDLSPQDKPWDKHRATADIVQAFYANSDLSKLGERISGCAKFLDFKLVPNAETGELKLKLSTTHFCRVRHCPVCQWRKSLMNKGKFIRVLPKILEDYPKARWVKLTLTIDNPKITDLRSTIDHLNKSFQRLSQRKNFPAVGWIKSLEVTKSQSDFTETELIFNDRKVSGMMATAHPHFHILMMVKPGYFGGSSYLSKEKWVELWKSCLRVNYDPSVHVKAVPEDYPLIKVLPEMIKYQVKESDMIDDRDWFLEMNGQLHKTRALEVGGILKPYLKVLEDEPTDLVGQGQDDEVDEGHLFFAWQTIRKHYCKVGDSAY
jgi:plasmid rolling circle replication initiator protein Rep